MRNLWIGAALAVLIIGCGDDGATLTAERCEVDTDCGDLDYCNGDDFCLNGFCATLPAPVCDDGIECTIDECSDARRGCTFTPPDADEDGVADAACRGVDGLPLGSDCDDDDPNRFPGNPEVCDSGNVDEDCDTSSFGAVDADGDGLYDGGCCNLEGLDLVCGTDCDDSNAAIGYGSQRCSGGPNEPGELEICQVDGTWVTSACLTTSLCEDQPNGTGVCVLP